MSGVANRNAGYYKKILQQKKALENLGMSVVIIDIASIGISELDGAGFRNTMKRRSKLLKYCETMINNGDVDAFYVRYPGGDLGFLRFAKEFGKMIITEHQTLEEQELASGKLRMRYISERAFGRKILTHVAGIVGVTSTICDYEVARSGDPSKPCLVNGNGIDISSVPLRTPPEFDGKNLDLLCVAQVAKWHGLDRLIKGIAGHKVDVDLRLHVVGKGSEVTNLKKLVTDLKLENSVIFHGFRTGKELDGFFDKCHIGIGSLARHRTGMLETSELKAREYCGRGIPFICSVPDSDFAETYPYVMRVPSEEEPVDTTKIISFAKAVASDRKHPQLMRQYALENLDWSVKMKRLIQFLEEIRHSHRKDDFL